MALMKTWPVSMPSMNSSISARSFVQTDAPRPKGELLATAIASLMLSTRNTDATGPKVSS